MSQESMPKDTVILHQTGRAKHTPALSPFAIKLETYLRMTNIPYKTVHGKKKSSKGKIPWIEYNSQAVADTTFIIEYLNKERDVDLSKELTDEQKAVGKAFQRMVEENLYWTLVYGRWIDKDLSASFRDNLPRGFMMDISMWRNKGQVQKTLQSHGIGRHSRDEIYDIAENDIRALSSFLGDKQFFFGDEGTEIDASIFGLMAVFAYEMQDSPQQKLIQGDCKNLLEYCERIKEKYWPDWNNCIMGDGPINAFPAVPENDPTVLRPAKEAAKKGAPANDTKATVDGEQDEQAKEADAPADGVVNGDAGAEEGAEKIEANAEEDKSEVKAEAANGESAKVDETADEKVEDKPEETATENAAEEPKESAEATEEKKDEKVEEEAEKAEDAPAPTPEEKSEKPEEKPEATGESDTVNDAEPKQDESQPQENGDAQPDEKAEEEAAK
ncbi:failed axon connections homolog [Ptychodera flava]|uniref:failed axon connections homolog n=1 Tax=Ptychodera flava TaxID=63121 RepID=UPI00396A08FA